nr:hypothetical protein CFP56_58164 [Quercus suber]
MWHGARRYRQVRPLRKMSRRNLDRSMTLPVFRLDGGALASWNRRLPSSRHHHLNMAPDMKRLSRTFLASPRTLRKSIFACRLSIEVSGCYCAVCTSLARRRTFDVTKATASPILDSASATSSCDRHASVRYPWSWVVGENRQDFAVT